MLEKFSRIHEVRESRLHQNHIFQSLAVGDRAALPSVASLLRIQRSTNGGVIFRISGRIEAEDVEELSRLFGLESSDHCLALDLRDVTLVDRDGVAFLARCEADGIKLENCPAYVREWLKQKKGRHHRGKRKVVRDVQQK